MKEYMNAILGEFPVKIMRKISLEIYKGIIHYTIYMVHTLSSRFDDGLLKWQILKNYIYIEPKAQYMSWVWVMTFDIH